MVDIVRIELNTRDIVAIVLLSEWQAGGRLNGFVKQQGIFKKDVGGIRYERITEDVAKELNLII